MEEAVAPRAFQKTTTFQHYQLTKKENSLQSTSTMQDVTVFIYAMRVWMQVTAETLPGKGPLYWSSSSKIVVSKSPQTS